MKRNQANQATILTGCAQDETVSTTQIPLITIETEDPYQI